MKPQYNLRKPEELAAALRDLRGFWKLWSACLLNSLGLPTLDGMIISESFPGLRQSLAEFIRVREPAFALIRHDKHPESPGHPRGGFLAGEVMLPEVIKYFIGLGRIVAVYESANPFLNGHNINILFETGSKCLVEVVGPGFDASDLQRGDLSPHESWTVSVSPAGTISAIELTQQVTAQGYQESVHARKRKIKSKLESSPTTDLAQKIRQELDIPDDLEVYLEQIDSPLLKSASYGPAGESMIGDTIRRVIDSGVISTYQNQTGVGFPLVISTSFVDRGTRQVFWDIVSPALKFEELTRPA